MRFFHLYLFISESKLFTVSKSALASCLFKWVSTAKMVLNIKIGPSTIILSHILSHSSIGKEYKNTVINHFCSHIGPEKSISSKWLLRVGIFSSKIISNCSIY